MSVRGFVVCLIAVLGLAGEVLAAASGPVITVDVEPSEVNVGQALRLRVRVLVPTWFTKPPVYPNFELANVLTRLPPDSSFPISERIAGETWSGIVRDYEIYPQLGARYVMSGQVMRIRYMNPDGFKPTSVDVPVPDVAFRASVPAGAESLDPFLAGSAVTLEREIEGDLAQLRAGDAIVVRLTATIAGMPAMFLPPLMPGFAQAGVVMYAKEPAVEDGAVAKRVESATVLFQGGGDFTLPGVRLGWWNVASQQVELASVPEILVTVAGPVVAPTDEMAASEVRRLDWRSGVLVIALVGVALVLRHWAPSLRRWWQRRSDQRRASEPSAFRALINAIGGGGFSEVDGHLQTWLARLGDNLTLTQLAQATATPELSSLAASIARSRYGRSARGSMAQLEDAHAVELKRLLKRARSRHLRDRRAAAGQGLPPLNPVG